MFFDTWHGLGRVLLVGLLAYAGLVLMLRISGKRTLSKMNAFDFVVTVALGSTLSAIFVSKDVALLEGFLALAWLIALQWIVAWLAVRSAAWRGLIKSEPRLLAFRGELNHAALRAERITASEVHSAVRSGGLASLAEVHAVVLETDGSVNVVPASAVAQSSSALTDVRGYHSNEQRG